MTRTHCDICDRNFKNEEALEMHNKSKHETSPEKPKKSINFKKIRNWAIFGVVIILLIWGVIALIPNTGGLPPTSMEGHTERVLGSHIQKKPFPLEVQKHMLEHADGEDGGPPGIIINYDCKNYDCSPDLIEKLEAFAIKYPANVYVAPFKKYG